jgi:hypothetical protein
MLSDMVAPSVRGSPSSPRNPVANRGPYGRRASDPNGRRTSALKELTRDAELAGMGSLTNLLAGGLLGAAIVAAFWLMVSFIDDLRRETHDTGH